MWSTNFYIERGGFQPMESKTTFSKYGLKHHLWFLVVTFFLFQVRRTSIMTPPAEKRDRSDLFRRKCVVTWTWEMWHSSVHFRHQAEMRKQERVSILFFYSSLSISLTWVEYTLDETTADILTWYYRFIPRLSGRRRNPEIRAKILNFPTRTCTSRRPDRGGQPILVWHSFFRVTTEKGFTSEKTKSWQHLTYCEARSSWDDG